MFGLSLASLLLFGSVGFDRSHFNIGTYCIKNEFRTEETFRKMKEAGFDYVVDYFPPSETKTREIMNRLGIKAVLLGRVPGFWGGDEKVIGHFAELAPLASYEKSIKEWAPMDGDAMFTIGDEMSALDFPHYGKVVDLLRRLCPSLQPHLNLHPAIQRGAEARKYYGTENYESYIAEYVKHVPLDYISYDLYPYEFRDRYDWGFARFYENMRIVADACRDSGRSFWYVAQANTKDAADDTTASKMRFSAYAAMAFGVENLNWACWAKGWWEKNIQNEDGTFGETYERVKEVNTEIRRFDKYYMKFRRVNTYFTGFTGDAAKWLESDAAGNQRRVNFNVADSLSTAFFTEIRAEDGKPLVVGDFVLRDGVDKERAILVFAADDPLDLHPEVRKVLFRTGRNVRIVGPDGEVTPVTIGNGKYSFELRSNRCAFIVAR